VNIEPIKDEAGYDKTLAEVLIREPR